MAWSPNLAPSYAVGPFAPVPVLLGGTAKTVMTDSSNATKVIDHTVNAITNSRIVLSSIDLLPTGPLAGCKYWLFLALVGASPTLLEKDEMAVASQSGFSTTVAGTPINFSRWFGSKPLIVPEGYDLWAACSLAQTYPPYLDVVGKLF